MTADDSRKGPRATTRRSAQADARQLRVVQRIADGLALDLNNALTAIVGRASVLKDETAADDPRASDIDAILEASALALELTRGLLDFSEKYAFTKEPLSLSELVGKTAAMWDRSAAPGVEVQLELTTDGDTVAGDASRLSQLLVQLGVNAVEAMRKGGVLKFTTQRVSVDKPQPADGTFSGLATGQYVLLQVSDTGAGMSPDTVQQAFEPFFSTKPTSASAGLGLARVYDIVKRHDGRVRLFSKQRLGTTVSVYFPAYESEVASPPAVEASFLAPSERGAVLLVDDDVHVLRMGKRLLEKLGHRVVATVDAEEGIRYFREHPGDVALAVVDLIMPRVDGMQTLRQLREVDARARVVIASAYASETAMKEAVDQGADAFLAKPYTLSALSAAIAQAVGEGGDT